MTVIVEKSVCYDCEGVSSCMRLKRLNPGTTIRDESVKLFEGVDVGKPSEVPIYKKQGRKSEVFEIIITTCSMKEQYVMRKKRGTLTEEEKAENMLYFCSLCKSMHRVGSDVGKAHRNYKDTKDVKLV